MYEAMDDGMMIFDRAQLMAEDDAIDGGSQSQYCVKLAVHGSLSVIQAPNNTCV